MVNENSEYSLEDLPEQKILFYTKIIVAVLLTISIVYTAHYHVNIKSYYENNPEKLYQEYRKLDQIMDDKKCLPLKEVERKIGYSSLRTRYILSKATQNISLGYGTRNFKTTLCQGLYPVPLTEQQNDRDQRKTNY